MRFLRSTRILRVVLSLTVASWMAGAGCLLGCEKASAAAAAGQTTHGSDLTVVASGDACASMQSHDCCASRNRTPQSSKDQASAAPSEHAGHELAGTSTRTMECPLAVNQSAVLAKKNQDPSGNALLIASVSPSHSVLREQPISLSPPLRLPNRGHTYLRCCVFLI